MVRAEILKYVLRVTGGGVAVFLFCWLLLMTPLYPGRALRFEVGGRWDALYLSGMHTPERGDGLTYRWASRDAHVRLPPWQSPALLTLRLVVAPLPAGQDVALAVQVGESPPVYLPPSKEMAVYHIVADTPDIALSGWDVHLQAASALQTQDDAREKSAALDWVQVTPLSRRWFPPGAPLLLLPAALASVLLYAGLLRVRLPWLAALGLAGTVPILVALVLWCSPTLGLLLLQRAAWPALLVTLAGFLFLLVPWLAFLVPYLAVLPYAHMITAPAMLSITLPVGIALAALAYLPIWWKRYWPAWLILGIALWTVLRFHLPSDALAFSAALLVPAIGLKERFGQHQGNLLVVLGLSLLAALPLLQSGLLRTFDIRSHLVNLNALDVSLRAGVLYPRWVSFMAYGYGSPAFNFYHVLPRYLGEAFHLILNLNMLDALNLSYAVGLPLSGFGMYLLARDTFQSPQAALLSAAAYMLFPYHLADIYVRGALSEALVLAFFPFVLWSFGRLLERPGLRWATISGAFLAGALLSQNAMTLVFMPLLLAYLLARGGRTQGWPALARWRTWKWPALGLACGLGLSAFYWLPALLQTPLIMMDRLVGTPLDPASAWPPQRLYGPWQDFFPLSFADIYADNAYWRPNLVQTLLALLGLGWAWRRRPWRVEMALWGTTFFVTLFFQTRLSQPIWEGLSLFRYLQFPWRLLALAGLATAPLIGALASRQPENQHRPAVMPVLPLGIALLLAVAVLPLPVWYQWRYSETGRNGALSTTEIGSAMPEDHIWQFLPTWTMPPELLRQGHRGVVRLEGVAPLPQVLEEEQGPASLMVRVRMPQAGTLRLNQTFFPGWQAEIDGQPATVERDPELGLVAVAVPAGEHSVWLRFADTPLQTGAWGLTAASVAGIVAGAIGQGLVHRRKSPPAGPLHGGK